jgi:hypothetical protein
MSGPAPIKSGKPYALEGVVFTGASGGPAIDTYRTAGGAYTQIYDAVGKRLVTRNEALILRELHRQDDAQRSVEQSPKENAAELLSGARFGPTHVNKWDTKKLAAQILQLRRDNPAQAQQIERQIMDGLGNVGDQSRLTQDIAIATRHLAAADFRLNTLGVDAPAPIGPVITKAALTRHVNDLIAGATEKATRSRINPKGVSQLNITELAYQVEQIAAKNPRLSQKLRFELTVRLGAQPAAELNRLLAGDTGFGDGVNLALKHPIDAAIGGGKGIVNGGIALADLLARGQMHQSAASQYEAAGMQSLLGNKELAEKLTDSAQALQKDAKSTAIPQIPYSNVAQSGGGDIGTVIDIAMAGKGLIGLAAKGSAKVAAKNVDEVAATATLIAKRKEVAFKFYESQGFAPSRITSHLDGIDFSKPVEVITLRKGTEVAQFQAPGSAQGNYYTTPGTTPSKLGINPNTQLKNGTIIPRESNKYYVTGDVEVLSSTAAKIEDTWSVPNKIYVAEGGGIQYFTTSTNAFKVQ